ncbi:hypothetical protein Tcan_10224 [Toxocara canis]|uniref:Uncharacterized protein n=1 Tax=Toxocara canis TaxID=6265 RepID=A0A0B2UNL0_TOXCA|nr:hypothetical protein Tcan_10224 [Toxocara canis]
MHESNFDFATASFVKSAAEVFDPNNAKYRCCCNQCHAITGVRIIAGMLCVTVVFELWHFIATLCSLREGGTGSAVLGSLFQLLIGVVIAASVIHALIEEKAAFLLPYLLLQTVGLAAGAVFFVSFLYISLFGDGNAILTFIKSQGHQMSKSDSRDEKQSIGYADCVGWLMVAAFAAVLALQIWLIRIVFACWRFYRDKRAFGFPRGYSSYVVIRAPFNASFYGCFVNLYT